jgi:ribosomal protein S11
MEHGLKNVTVMVKGPGAAASRPCVRSPPPA